MIKTVLRRRIEVFVDQPLARLVEAAAVRAGVTNWAFLPTVRGMARGVAWGGDELTDADRRLAFQTVLTEEKAAALLDALAPLLESHGLSVFVSTVEVIRPDRY